MQFGASRSMVSLSYSFALVVLTIFVLLGHRIFLKFASGLLVAMICLTAASGALIAAYAPSLKGVWLGYSLLFGGANGLGYAFALQMSALVFPGREGLVMGIITAFYALGAIVSPPLFAWLVSMGGFQWAMFGLAAVLISLAPFCAGLFKISGAEFRQEERARTSPSTSRYQLALLWIGFGAGVTAGLMAIGHATGIAKSAGLQQSLWIAPVSIAVFNMIGSLGAGWLSDRVKHTYLLPTLSLLSSSALLLLLFAQNSQFALLLLGVVGLAYGALISVYPATISKLFGAFNGTKIYGKVFTAWGTAGLFAPWLAGTFFDYSGNYTMALIIAAVFGLVSTVAIIRFNKVDVLVRS